MATLVKFANKNFNAELLEEEIIALGITWRGPLWAGFESLDNAGIYRPNAARKEIGRKTGPGGGPDIVDSADPGEIRFRFSSPITAAQETALDTVLADHDATQRTVEQTRRTIDVAEYRQLVTDHGNFDTLSNVEKDVVLKRAIRLLARRELGKNAPI